MRERWLGEVQLQAVLLLVLLTTASCWGFGRQKDALTSKAKHTQHKLPSSTFVRIFALPSFEADVAQHRLGELLASACKNYNRVGACKLYSATLGEHRVRILGFEDGQQSSVVGYMLQANEEAIEKTLEDCAARHSKNSDTQEDGQDYRCYKEKAVPSPTRDEVLEQLKEQLEKVGVYDQLAKAVHKSIFLTSDPRLIVYQEAHRLVGDNNDPDFFLQKIRDSFRRIVEWLSWQFQHFLTLSEGTPILFSHADDLDDNESGELLRILTFLEIEDLHIVEGAVTVSNGEIRFQKERLHAALGELPKALMADVEAFMYETLQDGRLLDRYVSSLSDRTALWPSPSLLQHVALDNTIMVTAATCSYAPLIINWIKHVHSTGIPCYLVVALDDEIYKFLHNWLPEHVVRAPQGFTPAVPRQFAETGTAAARHVSRARLASLKAIADQGYNVAWLDADIAMAQNIFTLISRWYDFGATWSGGGEAPLPFMQSLLGFPLKLKDEADRKISPSFLFVRGSEPAQQFLQKWWDAANSSHTTEDGMVLNNLMRDPEVTTGLNIQLFPEATFPSGSTLFANSTPAYKKEWEKQPPAWAHPDSVARRQDKIDLLAAGDNRYWKVIPEDPTPKCPRATEEYLADGTAVPVWPPPDVLKELAVDETVLVTAATCSYADLATNWIKHVWDLQIGCFLVAAADEPMSEFLGGWIPDHSAKMPADMVSKVKKFAQAGTAEYMRVVQSRPRILHAILTQGYKAAWSDADIVWLHNPFMMFDKTPDLVLAWADNSVVSPPGIFRPGQFPGSDKGRRVSVAFVYVNPSSLTLKLMERWAAKLGGSKFVDDAAALNELLLDPEFHPHLTLGIFASALFPSSAESTGKSQSAQLKEALEAEGNTPAWLHADMASHDGKVQLFKDQSQWRVGKDDPQPKCSSWGRKLGDDQEYSENPLGLHQTHHHHHISDDASEGERRLKQ